MEILAIEGLTKNFYLHNLGKTIKSCRDIGFTLHEGEFIGIVGRSGAGKSSILKCINRTYLPLQGTIVYNSQAFGPIDLAQADERQMLQLRRYEIGYVAQFLNVMPRTTAKEHVMSALLEIGVAAGEAIAVLRKCWIIFVCRRNCGIFIRRPFPEVKGCV